MKPKARSGARDLAQRSVGELLKRHPKTLEVFDRHGVHFCAGCFLTLTGELKTVAGHHAVEDLQVLLDDLREAIGKDA